jgi:hypothetical protein
VKRRLNLATVSVLGAPPEGGLSVPFNDLTWCVLRYGSGATGSVIELHQGVVVRARLGVVSFADYVYKLPALNSHNGTTDSLYLGLGG